MDQARATFFASGLAIASGVLWGLYWLPVRTLADAGLLGAWGTFAITLGAALLLGPFAYQYLQNITASSAIALGAVALGGSAFALYSIGFVYGRVAIIVLLFFLTPVWSTLIGRYLFGWTTPPLRMWAIIIGLIGLAIMLSADGTAPVPRNIGEWMGLASGIMWSVASTGMRTKSTLLPIPAAFVFASGAATTALLIALALAPFPQQIPHMSTTIIALGTGGIWWGLAMVGLMWATLRLEPARIGILLMSEVLVGAASAAILAGEHLSWLEILGGSFVLCAALLELWPTKPSSSATGRA